MDNITKLLVEMYKKRDPNAYLAAPVHISDLALIVEKQDAELGLLHLELAEARKVIENYSDRTDLDDCFSADTFLKKYPEVNK
jgi:hypothetical protein